MSQNLSQNMSQNMRRDRTQMRSTPSPNAARRPRNWAAALLVTVLAGVSSLGAAPPAGAAASASIAYVGLLAGAAVSDMYPVDVVDFGDAYFVVDPGRYACSRSIGHRDHRGLGGRTSWAGRTASSPPLGPSRSTPRATSTSRTRRPTACRSSRRPVDYRPSQDLGNHRDGGRAVLQVYGITVGIGRGIGGAPTRRSSTPPTARACRSSPRPGRSSRSSGRGI